MIFSANSFDFRRRKVWRRIAALSFSMIFLAFLLFSQNACKNFNESEKAVFFPEKSTLTDKSKKAVENAIFTKQEFFGAEAIVPLPTAQARENLLKISINQPDDPKILEKLAEFHAKLSDFGEAEKVLVHLAEIDFSQNEALADFYRQRGEYAKQAQILEKTFFSAPAQEKPATLEKLLETAKHHDLQQYLQADFYAEIIDRNPNFYPVFEKLITKLSQEENYPKALEIIRRAKSSFPDKSSILLEKEIDLLMEMNRSEEAEKIYRAAFDPFWSAEDSRKFYSFLSRRDRLRLYGSELRRRFTDNPADFETAVRLAHYLNYDFKYENDDILPIISKLEQSKKDWTTEELVTVARLLLQQNEGEAASRFLYTLYLRADFQQKSDLRAKVLYQLFEMFADAENQKLPITKGDLRFYEDIARADTHPGITTGILSLLFADTNPRRHLEKQEEKAMKFFNRAAAYRVFEEYKKENPKSLELAQMYLDIVRLYTATDDTATAEKTLDEFSKNYENSADFPAAALKLADAYITRKRPEKEREIYQKILDFLGKSENPLAPPKQSANSVLTSSRSANFGKITEIKPRNEGINIPSTREKSENDDFSGRQNGFRDFLHDKKLPPVSYEEVFDRYVSSLARASENSLIFTLYTNEIAKYPTEERLYEKFSAWLEKTDLAEEKLKIYKSALARFPSVNWRDKAARFFIREKRQEDLVNFSRDLLEKTDDEEFAKYLSQIAENNISGFFEKEVVFALYQSAHEKFPNNMDFVRGLLRYYKQKNLHSEWRKLCATYYFTSKEIRDEFLADLAQKGELRVYLQQAADRNSSIYELFRADTAVYLSDFESALDSYRQLVSLYPNEPEFSNRLVNLTRSFGQKDSKILAESAGIAESEADFLVFRTDLRVKSGEIFAEAGNYQKASAEWEKIVAAEQGNREIYLSLATLYWDYFQYEKALQTIFKARKKFADNKIYAFEAGVIFEEQNKRTEAFAQYVKAFASEDYKEREKSVKRLVALFRRIENDKNQSDFSDEIFPKTFDFVFNQTKKSAADISLLELGYAEFLFRIKQNTKAENVLQRAVRQSRNAQFLENALETASEFSSEKAKRIVLQKLAESAEKRPSQIDYALQLAENFAQSKETIKAKNVLKNLVGMFPTNYGVLVETSDSLARLGFADESIRVLRNALPKSVGQYRILLAQKLAKHLIANNELAYAEQILTELYRQNPADINIFESLADIFVRRQSANKLQSLSVETIKSLRNSDLERDFVEEQISLLRSSLIQSFTKLGDYKSALEQHIEIINQKPDDETAVKRAISFVKRYGGAEKLLDYYRKLSLEAFKNYRWSIVLAEIYEADGDFENALKNYENALINSPEMPEIHLAIAEIETKRRNYEAAISRFNTILELTQDAPVYIKKKIEVLKLAGKLEEAAVEKAKLPREENLENISNDFAESAKNVNHSRDETREIYRKEFSELLKNPLAKDIKSGDLATYVELIRDDTSLAEIHENLWILRAEFLEITENSDSEKSEKARRNSELVETVLINTVGNIAKNVATDEELRGIHADLQTKIEKLSANNESQNKSLSLIQNIANRAGFGDVEEKILLKRIERETSASEKEEKVMNLLNFYNTRGLYEKSFEILEKFGTENESLKAETTRLAGNTEKELESLRKIYWKSGAIKPQEDRDVARFLEILRKEKRGELISLTAKSSAYQLQLINFLIENNEKELAHAAITNASLETSWKSSRNAETSLFLREFDENAECYFCDALQLNSIGNLRNQTPDRRQFLVGDDWFNLTYELGEWLYEKELRQSAESSDSEKFLVALTENYPQNVQKQLNLGNFYLAKNRPEKALEHLRLAVEISRNTESLTTLSVAYFKTDQRHLAEELSAEILKNAAVKETLLFFQIMQRHGLAAGVHEITAKKINEFLSKADVEKSSEFQILIRNIANSFPNEKEKTAYFLRILQKNPTDTSLSKMIISENLVARNFQNIFYEILLEQIAASDWDYDYAYREVYSKLRGDTEKAEAVYAQENNFEIEKPDNERIEYQKVYLELLISTGESAKAEKVIKQIQAELKGRFAAPDWLKLALIRLQIQQGKTDWIFIERFIGITAPEETNQINPPDIARFNGVLEILHQENSESAVISLSEKFFARMLAFEKLDNTYFIGLAKVFFRQNNSAKALKILDLSIRASSQREEVLAELEAFAEIKNQKAESFKVVADSDISLSDIAKSLENAAEICAEFNQIEHSLNFRRKLLEIAPENFENAEKLAQALFQKGEKATALEILSSVISGRKTTRVNRWKARQKLAEFTGNTEFPQNDFDAFSLFYSALQAENSTQNEIAERLFAASLLADISAETFALQKLTEIFARRGNHFAALRLAQLDKSEKNDNLLEMLCNSAIETGDLQKALEFEKAKTGGGNPQKILLLHNKLAEKIIRRSEFTVDLNQTRKL